MDAFPLPAVNWLAALPTLILSFTAVLTLFWDLWLRDEERQLLAWLSLTGLVLAALVSVWLWGRHDSAFSGMFALDSYALVFTLIFCLAGALTVLMSLSYLRAADIQAGEYYALLLFATVGMVVMAAATDLILIFVGLETMSLAVYVLTGIWRRRLTSHEAALKYFLLGAFASGFLLYGIALVYGATGSLQLATISLQVAHAGSSPLLLTGMGLLIVGFGFKVAAAPFHVWAPDVYQGAPTTVTAFMAVAVKAAAFAAFARVFLYALEPVHADWQGILWILAALTMTVGNVTALVQTNIKRMLAYSSIAHAGYLLVAMVPGNALGGGALIYYLMAYGLMNLGAFGVVIAVGRRGDPNEELDDYAGLGFRHPALGMAMTIFMLSLTGVPPLVGFTGKFYIFSAAVDGGYIWLAVIGVLNSVVSAYYYIRVVVNMYMREGEKMIELPSLGPALAAVIIVTALGTVLMGIFPAATISLARESISSLG